MEIIERNAQAQTDLIEDILDVSHIIAGKMRVHLRKVAPARGHPSRPWTRFDRERRPRSCFLEN